MLLYKTNRSLDHLRFDPRLPKTDPLLLCLGKYPFLYYPCFVVCSVALPKIDPPPKSIIAVDDMWDPHVILYHLLPFTHVVKLVGVDTGARGHTRGGRTPARSVRLGREDAGGEGCAWRG